MIFAIDPGTTESGVCAIDEETYKPVFFFKTRNAEVLQKMRETAEGQTPEREWGLLFLIERVASYGKRIGNEVLQTAEWCGRFYEQARMLRVPVRYIYRREVKLELLGNAAKTDADVKRALIDRFAEYDFKQGKGTKKKPDFFHGFKADIWQAYALGVAFLDMERKQED